MHRGAEEDAQPRTQSGQEDDLGCTQKIQLGDPTDCKGSRCNPAHLRNPVTGQRTHQTGQQRCVLHHPDTDHLHRKDSGGQRGAEQRRKAGAHPAHNHHLMLPLIQRKPICHLSTQTAANLQSCAFSAGGTAQQMGQDGADKISGAVRSRSGCSPRTASRMVLVPISFSIPVF